MYQKNQLILSNKYSVMKLSYKGSKPEVQRCRGKKNAKIDVVDSGDNTTPTEGDNSAKTENVPQNMHEPAPNKTQTPEWNLKIIEYGTNKVVEFDGFNLNHEDASGIVIEIS